MLVTQLSWRSINLLYIKKKIKDKILKRRSYDLPLCFQIPPKKKLHHVMLDMWLGNKPLLIFRGVYRELQGWHWFLGHTNGWFNLDAWEKYFLKHLSHNWMIIWTNIYKTYIQKLRTAHRQQLPLYSLPFLQDKRFLLDFCIKWIRNVPWYKSTGRSLKCSKWNFIMDDWSMEMTCTPN